MDEPGFANEYRSFSPGRAAGLDGLRRRRPAPGSCREGGSGLSHIPDNMAPLYD
jgi:hypothetical protein